LKSAAGALIQAFESASLPGATRASRLYQAILEAIFAGRLPPGERLPSARALARDWKVARGVVDEAFSRLQDEGLLVRRVGDGTYVAYPLPRRTAPGEPRPAREPTASAQRVLSHFAPFLQQTRRFEGARQPYRPPVLHPRGWPVAEFPLARWRRLVAEAYDEPSRDQLGYGPAAGVPALREAIARHLALTRSVQCSAQQVVVVNGPKEGLETLARVLLTPGDRVWVEDPGHPSLPLLFEMLHMHAVGVPLDALGFDVERARELAADARLVYLHPLAQYPLGIRTGGSRGNALLNWADERGGWIVEGCFNDEVVYRQPVPPALLARDGAERVILMGTFEGVMFPSLRIGYLVVPERLADAVIAARGLLGDHNAVAPQVALARFIGEGHLSAHLRRIRQVCAERRDALLRAVHTHLPSEVTVGPVDSGFHACLHLAARWRDSEVVTRLRTRQIGAEALSSRCWQVRDRNGLIVSFAAATPEEIDGAVARIGEVLRQT